MNRLPLLLISLALLSGCGILRKGSSERKPTPLSDEVQREVKRAYEDGVSQRILGNESAAMDLFLYATSKDSLHDAAHFNLGLEYIRLNNATKALEHMGKAYSINPGNYWYGVGLLNLTKGMKMYDSAIKVIEKQIKTFPDRPELYYEMADLMVAANRPKDALLAMDSLEYYFGTSDEILQERIKLYFTMGDSQKGFDTLDTLISNSPNNIKYPLIAGNLCMEAQKYEQALKYLNEALRIEPNNGLVQISLSDYYELMGNDKMALEMTEQAIKNDEIELNVKLEIIRNRLTQLLKQKKSIEDCESLFDGLVDKYPQSEELFQLYAAYLSEIGKMDEAREKLEVVVSLSPLNRDAWTQLLQLELKEKDYSRVVKLCKRAIEYHPTVSFFYIYSGIAYTEMKEEAKAIKIYEAGIKALTPTDPKSTSDLYGQLGDLYQKQNNQPLSMESYDKALQFNPKNIVVMNNYAYYLSVLGNDLSKAEKLSAQTVEAEPTNSTYLDTYAWIFFMQKNYSLARIYIESAINHGGENSGTIIEHYGDILYFCDEKEEAVEQWEKASKLSDTSKQLPQKILQKKYID